jgi:hypothetical protein
MEQGPPSDLNNTSSCHEISQKKKTKKCKNNKDMRRQSGRQQCDRCGNVMDEPRNA